MRRATGRFSIGSSSLSAFLVDRLFYFPHRSRSPYGAQYKIVLKWIEDKFYRSSSIGSLGR